MLNAIASSSIKIIDFNMIMAAIKVDQEVGKGDYYRG